MVTKKANSIKSVQKRDGRLVDFNFETIINAISRAFASVNPPEAEKKDAEFVARNVLNQLIKISKVVKDFTPTVEGIQDLVEKELINQGYATTAKHFILFRDERARRRKAEGQVPQHVKELVEKSKTYFRNSLGEFTYFRSYSRWIENENRRETWIETVDRYMGFMHEKLEAMLSEKQYLEIREAILRMDVMPSMRLMWSAGDAARRTNVAAFNCAYTAPKNFQDLGEILYISCCGTGVGFSVEAENVEDFPKVKPFIPRKKIPINIIEDSKEGWADSLVHGLGMWYDGADVTFDYSQIRPSGARLKTMGGRASGPDPLRRLLDFTRNIVLGRQGRRLTRLDIHDINCMIGDIVVSGGVRRSALISLSDLDDNEIRSAKEGYSYITHKHRQMANNSAVYQSRPSDMELMEEWLSLAKSGAGERGIFNRGGLIKQMPDRRVKHWEDLGLIINDKVVVQAGTNPCGEITLLPKEFCNLTEVVCRGDDTQETLLHKIGIATILGTYQSMLTNFPYLSKQWKENSERERLLGVSLTGIWDCPDARNDKVLDALKKKAISVNKIYAEKFGISASMSVTCVKPSGTVSSQVDSSSGMHPRHAPFYIRRIRISATDPLFIMLKDQGLSYFPVEGQTYDTANTFVLEFPVKSPEGSVVKKDLNSLDQLDHWKSTKLSYTEHNPSVTISVGNEEWVFVLHWLVHNWDYVGGLSFLPRDDMVYQLAPYEEIDEKKYNEMIEKFKHIDYAKIITYEKEDNTQGSKELACSAGVCEL